jgi:eukaryotic-like serine/threonine-protein kinase
VNITAPFVLRSDVVLVPCAELSDDVRARMTFEDGDYTLSRSHGRTLAQVIDPDTAALLSLFREPRTIVEAVVENSRAIGRDPEARLDELLPHLGKFLQNRVLVPAGSEDDGEMRPRLASGETIAGWQIVRCAQLMEDCELYQLRRGEEVAALKIARATTPRVAALLANETAILRRLDGADGIAPRLLDAGTHDGRPYVVMEWIDGVDAAVAAAQRRHDRAALIELCARIAAAYATLHARGIVHADVHPRNVLAGERVVLIDFGYARPDGDTQPIGRGGVAYFFEPERDAVATAAGEQYSVAALLYMLIAGEHYLDFRYDREEMSRQTKTEPPVPFAARGIPPWPEVEAILFRALEKDPARRHASMNEMAARLAASRDVAMRESLSASVSAEAQAFLDATLRSFSRGGAMFARGYTTAPTASVSFGCAGAAIGLLRIAEARSDPALLALANVWRSRAVALIGTGDAYYNAAGRLPRERLGDVTPYHTESGIHAVAALIAAAMGDAAAQRRTIGAFVRASQRPCAELDLALGLSGSLLAAAMLMPLGDDSALRAFGSATMREIWEALDARPPLAASPAKLGIAHGWAGYCYAALRWCAASGDALPPRLTERLHELASLAIAKGRGAAWPIAAGDPSRTMTSWCNGAPGHVFLFTLAHRLLRDDAWLQLAARAAWSSWDEPRAGATLCCGTAGRAYALLNLYKHTGAREWLSRARELANDAAAAAAASAQRVGALWKGELGAAVLIADLASPESARMPLFE